MTTGIDPIGVVGLGIMGTAVSSHLINQGFTVIGYDIVDSACIALIERGGVRGGSPIDVAQQCDIVLTLLPSAAAFNDVLFGPKGLAETPGRRLVVVDMSTLALQTKQAGKEGLDAQGITLMDCPISGTGAQAQNKDIAVYASGPYDAYERCLPVLRAMSRSQFYVGDFGAGSRMKFIANLLVAIHNVAAAEAVVLARKAGIDPELMVNVVSQGAGSSRMLEVRGPMMASGLYDHATMKLKTWEKDMQIIREFAAASGAPTFLFSVVDQLYTATSAVRRGDEDTAAVCGLLEKMAGI